MKFTTDRPTKPGDYWLSIHPDKRPSAQRSDVVFPDVVPFILYGGGQGSYRAGGSMLDLSDPWFDGAQWAPRETPADPFAQSAGTWSPRIAVLEKIAGALGYRIEIMPGLDVAGRCHYHRRLIEIGEPDARYAFSVIAHELGHALHGCLVEDVETARTKEQREACATAFASAIGMMAGCEHGCGAECNLAHAPTAESMGAVLDKIAPSLPPWRAELERLRGLIIKPASTSPEEYQRLTQRLVALEELDALRSGVEAVVGKAIVPHAVGIELGDYCAPCAYDCMELPTVVSNGHWECQRGGHWYPVNKPAWLSAIDAAGAAVLASE